MRTSSTALTDQPASSSGFMSGPLDENANAEPTANTSPDGAKRGVSRSGTVARVGTISGTGAVGADMRRRSVRTVQ